MRKAFRPGREPCRSRLSRRTCARAKAGLRKVRLWAQETGEKFGLLFVGRARHVIHRSDHILGTASVPGARHGGAG